MTLVWAFPDTFCCVCHKPLAVADGVVDERADGTAVAIRHPECEVDD